MTQHGESNRDLNCSIAESEIQKVSTHHQRSATTVPHNVGGKSHKSRSGTDLNSRGNLTHSTKSVDPEGSEQDLNVFSFELIMPPMPGPVREYKPEA